jgi:hypothetical protein
MIESLTVTMSPASLERFRSAKPLLSETAIGNGDVRLESYVLWSYTHAEQEPCLHQRHFYCLPSKAKEQNRL